MLRITLLSLSLCLFGNAADSTYYSYSAFENAAPTGIPFITETFTGNQINTAGLLYESCTGLMVNVCGGSGNSLITGDRFTDGVGRFVANPYNPNAPDQLYHSSVFTFPEATLAVGFDLIETTPGASSLGIQLGQSTTLYPFGGVSDSEFNLPNPGYSYNGFVGFVSDQPFDTLTFSAFGGAGVPYELDNLTFDDPNAASTPEPATIGFGLLGFLLAGSMFWRKLMRVELTRDDRSDALRF